MEINDEDSQSENLDDLNRANKKEVVTKISV